MRYLLTLAIMAALAFPAYAAEGQTGQGGNNNSTVATPQNQGGYQGGGPFQGPSAYGGGFQGPSTGVNVDTVAKARSAWDDTPVSLTGNIISHLPGTKDKYMFRDSTGEIMVDIDWEVFAGRNVTPQNTVRIMGEVDTSRKKPTKIDVKYLEITK